MLAAVAVAVVQGAQTFSMPSPHGGGKISFRIPPGYRITSHDSKATVLANGPATIKVTGKTGIATDSYLKALHTYDRKAKSAGQILGDVSIGPFKGQLERIPLANNGFALHSALIAGRDQLSITYWNPMIQMGKLNPTVQILKEFIGSAR